MIAFGGDAAVRDRLVETIEWAIETQDFLPDAENAMPGRDSALMAAVGTRDLDRFEQETGYPGSLGLLLDGVVHMIAGDRRGDARAVSIAWFASVEPGVDLLPAASRFAMWMLDQCRSFDAGDPALADIIATLRGLHDRVAHGDKPERAAWSAPRAAALAIADRGGDATAVQLAELAAGLAWPVDRSRAVLVENVRLLCGMIARDAVERTGWTDDRRDACSAVMHAIWDEMTETLGRAPFPYEFQPHFEQSRPEVAKPFTDALATENQAHSDAAFACAEAALKLIGAPGGLSVERIGSQGRG